jgi:hypothetical protein
MSSKEAFTSPSKDLVLSRNSRKSGYGNPSKLPVGVREFTVTSVDGLCTESGRNRRPSWKLKMAEFAPIARAMEMIAVRANPGF